MSRLDDAIAELRQLSQPLQNLGVGTQAQHDEAFQTQILALQVGLGNAIRSLEAYRAEQDTGDGR